jgi:ribosomal protein S13
MEDYNINIEMVLACQQRVGIGGAGANKICGQLGLSTNAFHQWTELEESICSALIKLGTKILKENLETKKKLSKFDNALQKHH